MENVAKKQILICDDDPNIRRLIAYGLRKQGHEAIESKCAEGGLAVARVMRPQLIFLDSLNGPISGLDCVKRLKAHPKTRNIPIVMCTAKRDRRYVLDCKKAGAVAFIAKPFELKDLLDRVEDILSAPTATENVLSRYPQLR